MFNKTTRARRSALSIPHVSLAVAVVFALASCGGKDDSLAANAPRQIDLAPSKAAEPQLADAPLPAPAETPSKAPAKARVRPAPAPAQKQAAAPSVEAPAAIVTPAPAPVTAAPAAPAPPSTGTVAAGSVLTLKPAARICTNTHRPGDRFTATLTNAIDGSNGVEIPAGAVAVLRIVDAPKDVSRKDSLYLAYDILSVRVGEETYEVNAHLTQSSPLERVGTQSTTDKAKKIGGGAFIGAIAGRILGGNTKGAVVGGAVGAAAGAAAVVGSEQFNGCMRDDATITLALDKPLTIKLVPKP